MQEPLASSPQPASAGAAGGGEARAAKASGETSVNTSIKKDAYKPAEPRLLSRLKWSLIGGVVALLALALLWWNEARIDATRLLQRAQVVDPGVSFPENDGRLVAVSGPLRVPEPRLLFSYDKTFLTPARLINFLALVITFQGVYERLVPYVPLVVKWLSSLGRNSLAVFCVGSIASLIGQIARYVSGGGILIDLGTVLVGGWLLCFTAWFVEWRSRFADPSPG